MLNYLSFFEDIVGQIKAENRYRQFPEFTKSCKHGIIAKETKTGKQVVFWCTNDYLCMSANTEVLDAYIKTAISEGVGSGGTRNIGGNNSHIVALEKLLSELHKKESALVFTSGYVANSTTLSTLARLLPGCVLFSDESNHASIIDGIRHSRVEKYIFKHNNTEHLEELISKIDLNIPKIIVFESAYSMDGLISPMQKICAIAKKYNALTYVDEVHTVGLYGTGGSGMANSHGVDSEIDIIQGTLAKAYGTIGGYIAGNKAIVDAVRSSAPGFIFTTSLPPSIAAASIASIKYVRDNDCLRATHTDVVNKTKAALRNAKISFIENDTHIIPVMVNDPIRVEIASRRLLDEFGIYVQHINYPTVPKGTERLRITPTPLHTDEMISHLVSSLKKVLLDLEVTTIAA